MSVLFQRSNLLNDLCPKNPVLYVFGAKLIARESESLVEKLIIRGAAASRLASSAVSPPATKSEVERWSDPAIPTGVSASPRRSTVGERARSLLLTKAAAFRISARYAGGSRRDEEHNAGSSVKLGHESGTRERYKKSHIISIANVSLALPASLPLPKPSFSLPSRNSLERPSAFHS